jgi:septal ring factor EnvC (AmiA/AmiB activator)
MNEQNQKYLRYGAYALCIALAACVLWLLFRDIRADSRTDVDVTEQLDSAAAEQREAEKSLDRIDRGIDDSSRTVDAAETAINGAQESVDRITESAGNIENAINRAEDRNGECQNIIADSERRIAESQRILQEVPETAGKGPGPATTAENIVADTGSWGNGVRGK